MKNGLLKKLLLILLVILILLGVFGISCGVFLTLIGLSGDDYKSILNFSLPSIIIGVLFVYLGYKGKNKVVNKDKLDWWQILLPTFLCGLIAFGIFFFFYGY